MEWREYNTKEFTNEPLNSLWRLKKKKVLMITDEQLKDTKHGPKSIPIKDKSSSYTSCLG